jgi:hypothetical protein
MTPRNPAFRGLRAVVPATFALLLGLLFLAPSAGASFQSIFLDYQSDGAISACSHSLGDLQSTQGQIPNDIEQYAPDFPGAVAGAIGAHARGDCEGVTPAPEPTPGAAAPPPPSQDVVIKPPPAPPKYTAPKPAAPVANPLSAGLPAEDHGTPAPLIVLGAVSGLSLLAALIALVASALGLGIAWLTPIRHGISDAALRASGALETAADGVRAAASRRLR